MFNLNRPKQAPVSGAQSFFDSYLPTIIQIGALSIPIVYGFYEKYYGYENLSWKVRKDLQSTIAKEREGAINILHNDLSTEKENDRNELHYKEHASAAFDFGFFDILYNEITTRDNSEDFVVKSLSCMKKMIEAEDGKEYSKRHVVLNKYGVKKLFEFCVHENLAITEAALQLMNSLSNFDRFRRWTIDDVSNGSQGCILLQYIPDQQWDTFIDTHLSTSDVEVLNNATAILAHASEYPKTAKILSKRNAIRQLVVQLRSPKRDVGVNALVAISKIFEAEPRENWKILFNSSVLSNILRLASPLEKFFYQPPDEISEHSILLILYTMSLILISEGTREQREEFTKTLVQNRTPMLTIFMLSESSKQSSTKQLSQFNELIDSPNWSSNHTSLIRVRHEAMSTLEEARVKYQRMMKQRRQQQMQQMGLDMGMPGMPGMPGMMG